MSVDERKKIFDLIEENESLAFLKGVLSTVMDLYPCEKQDHLLKIITSHYDKN